MSLQPPPRPFGEFRFWIGLLIALAVLGLLQLLIHA